MKKIPFLLLTFFSLQIISAQDFTMPLWPEGAPNKTTPPTEEQRYEKHGRIRYSHVTEAELFVYSPDAENNTGAAVVICPGGGYWIEAFEKEGSKIAEYFRQNGITGIVLKYRLPYGNPEVPLSDALHAVRSVRANAEKWNINPEKIGIAGSSAGGHLASMAGTQFNFQYDSLNTLKEISARPDFMLLIYPVISMAEGVGHMGSRINLIGQTNDWELARKYSSEYHVNKNTPPTFLVLAGDDNTVPAENSMRFYTELIKNKVPAEMHIFSKGGHGFGMETRNLPADKWPPMFLEWMRLIKMMP